MDSQKRGGDYNTAAENSHRLEAYLNINNGLKPIDSDLRQKSLTR